MLTAQPSPDQILKILTLPEVYRPNEEHVCHTKKDENWLSISKHT